MSPRATPKIEVFQGRGRVPAEWYWRLVGANGEPMAVSEGYPSEDGAKRGAADALKALADPDLRVVNA